MSEQDKRNEAFRQIADSFIADANKHCDDHDKDLVAASLLYSTARFSAYIAASGSKDLSAYQANRKNAIDYFTKQFKDRLEENLNDYETGFKPTEAAND